MLALLKAQHAILLDGIKFILLIGFVIALGLTLAGVVCDH